MNIVLITLEKRYKKGVTSCIQERREVTLTSPATRMAMKKKWGEPSSKNRNYTI